MTTDHKRPELPPLHEGWLPREHAQYRPRHGGRQLMALVCAAVFFTVPVLALGLGAKPAEIENRRLVDFPSLSQGWGFFSGLTQWATDHLALRSEAIKLADDVSRGLFGEPPNFDRRNQGTGPITAEQPQAPPLINVPPAIEGKNGWMYYGDDIVSRCNQAKKLDATMEQLRRLRKGVEESGRTFVLLVAPDKSTVVPEYLPDDFVGRECFKKVNDELWRRLGPETGALDLRDKLRMWGDKLGRPVYPPLDGHWGDEGGVVLAQSLAEELQPGITKSWAIAPVKPWRVPAELPPLVGRTGFIDGFYYSVKPDGQQDQVREVPNEFTAPLRLTSARGLGTLDERVGLLGDSFTIRALRYLGATFSDLTVLHYRSTEHDAGKAAGEMLAAKEVVAIEVVERTLASGNSVLLNPAVVDGITKVLTERPIR